MSTIEVRTQTKLEAALDSAGAFDIIAIVGTGWLELTRRPKNGTASVTAYGSASVAAYGSASVAAYGTASVTAYGSASVAAYGSASVAASGSASVAAYGTASVAAYGTASVAAYGTASVRAYGTASVTAYGTASVRAYGSASVRAYDTASVAAYGTASVRAYGTASVAAYGSASVRAYGSASVAAYGSASVTASGSASVRAYDTASVAAYGSASVTATPFVAVHRRVRDAARVTVTGGVLIEVPDCDTPESWCLYHGIEPDADGRVTLHKAVDDDWSTDNARREKIAYGPGTTAVARDWKPTAACGNGLHACATPHEALAYNETATRFVQVRAPLASLVVIDETKVKAPRLESLLAVDVHGVPLAVQPEAPAPEARRSRKAAAS